MMRFPETESSTIELKRALPQKELIIKTAIAFCNLHGGKIIIGVSDDRQIIGMTEEEIETTKEVLETSIFNACTPHIIPRIYAQRFQEKTILVIEISEGMNKPYYQTSKGMEKGTYIRLGRHTMRATDDIIQELRWQSKGIDFEKLPVYQASMQDINMKDIENFLSQRRNQGNAQIDEHILKSYGLVIADQTRQYPTTLGILLFGTQPQQFFSEAMIICTHFQGVSGREAIATVDCEGTLLNQFNQAFSFILSRLFRSFTINGVKREETLELPDIALREALLNAIVHRNYHIKAPTKIAIYDDRIEFFSPGQFPGPLDVKQLTKGISYLRNPFLCKILRELNYIEKMGTGFIAIFNSYQQTRLKPPVIINGENYVKCILPREHQSEVKAHKEDECMAVLDLIKHHEEVTSSDIGHALSISKATATRRLNQLVEAGEIERVGKGKSTRYRLARN